MRAVAAVLVGMITAHEVRIALPHSVPVGVLAEPKHRQRPLLRLRETRRLCLLAYLAEAGGNGVERIGEIAPPRRRIGAVCGEAAARPVPAGERMLRAGDLVGAHPVEEIILRV